MSALSKHPDIVALVLKANPAPRRIRNSLGDKTALGGTSGTNADFDNSVNNGSSLVMVKNMIPTFGQLICSDFSSEGDMLACVTQDKTVVIWKTITNLFDTSESQHGSRIRDVHFVPYTSCIAASSLDKIVEFWDANKLLPVQVFILLVLCLHAMEMEHFRVRFKVKNRLDRRTFNASANFVKRERSYPGTVRLYENISLAKAVYKISNSVKHPFVARAKYIEIPDRISDKNAPIKVAFEKFYPQTFNEWLRKSHGDDEINKVFRSIAAVIEVFHGQNYCCIGCLKTSIRINDKGDVQFVLDSKPTGKMKKGVAQDIKRFIQLVVRVFKPRSTVGYRYFSRLVTHFRSRREGGLKKSLRSYAYFILHNPLFYDVVDRYECGYKLKMFRDMKPDRFDKLMFPKWAEQKEKQVPKWCLVPLSQDAGLEKIFTSRQYKEYEDSEGTILSFYQNCHSHLVNIDMGTTEVQERLDRIYPNVISYLYYFFVTRIESKKVFEKYEVLGLYKGTHLSFRHLK